MEEIRENRSWFRRNWPWAVPVGGCLTLIILIMVFASSLFFGISKVLTGSDAYQEGLNKAQQDEYIIEKLGEPIDPNGIMQGTISTANDHGKADISIPIEGPKGKGRIYVVGTKENGAWSYSEMYVILEEDDEYVDLLWGKGAQGEKI